MSLKEQVEKILPNWEQWYPSVYEAAVDLGLVKETPNNEDLDLRRRHKKVRKEAEEYFRDKWNIDDEEL